jgi:hypothetical protein
MVKGIKGNFLAIMIQKKLPRNKRQGDHQYSIELINRFDHMKFMKIQIIYLQNIFMYIQTKWKTAVKISHN